MKKNDLNKAKVAVLAYSAAMAIGSMVVPSAFAASGSCTAGTTTGGVTCAFTVDAAAPFASDFNFIGSNEVTLATAADTTGFSVCGHHARGKNSYGLTLAGGSMKVLKGITASVNLTGGCI